MSNRNVRTRLTLWYVLVMGAILIAFSVGILAILERSLSSALDDTVTDRTEALIAVLDIDDGRPVLPDAVVTSAVFDEFDDDDDNSGDPIVAQDEEQFARTYDIDGNLVSNAGANPRLPQPDHMISDALEGHSARATIGQGEDSFRVLTRPVLDGDELVGAIEVGQPREDLVETLDALMNTLLLALPVTLAVVGAGGWFLAWRALGPVDRMTGVARRISAEDLSQRLNLTLPDDEFGRLARTLDSMIERLDIAFQQQRQFTADASHELRTPLTALKGHIEVTLENVRAPDEYREALTRIDGEVERLISLVQRLLVLARADAGQIPIEREMVAVSQLVEAATEQLIPQAEQRGVELSSNGGPDHAISADDSLLLQLLMNLIDNAIRHTPPGGTVSLSWRSNESHIEIDVKDTGEGIAPEDLPHVFERFFRSDRARSRREASTGLGLAISQWIAHAHGGSIVVSSQPGAGACFTVLLPVSASRVA